MVKLLISRQSTLFSLLERADFTVSAAKSDGTAPQKNLHYVKMLC